MTDHLAKSLLVGRLAPAGPGIGIKAQALPTPKQLEASISKKDLT